MNYLLSLLLPLSALAVPTTTPSVIMPLRNTIKEGVFSPKISYQWGHPVLTNDVNLYYIYYGSFTNDQKETLEHFGDNIGDSTWYNINRKYYSADSATSPKTNVSGKIKVAKTVTDNYSRGKVINGTMIPEIIQDNINKGLLPEDTSAIYFFLTAGDVHESIRPDLGKAAFCEQYCGYHVSWKLKSGQRIFYSQVGNPTACLDGCASPLNAKGSPNNDIGVDAMTSVIAHELVEAVTDPESDGRRAWQDTWGYENGDKCAWTYGVTQKDEKNSTYNVDFAGRKYLIQRNWDPVLQACANAA